MTDPSPEPADSLDSFEKSLEQRRLAQETKDERRVWWFLGYFLFGIHIVAFVMIYAVRHGH
ncbi:hypothetical protein [Streptomyces alanosinicus]|uniref:Uncharacterized protein n=1 Tax=Streptomyces alanosinicus TaxID=68171 RepID=A0A918YR30_9ACTN|nr:hypothetical protein [Streptomyces alanosinicus]GHE11884.1 hypothetical protein GCM10010339_73290 [Streptomyces alanosinicus]